MSAGAFETARYEAGAENGGGIYSITVQPETLALQIGGVTNASPAGAVDQIVRAKARKGTREYGVGARAVRLEFTGSPPTAYSGDQVVVPVMTPDAFLAYTVGATGTYLGAAVAVVSRLPERIR